MNILQQFYVKDMILFSCMILFHDSILFILFLVF